MDVPRSRSKSSVTQRRTRWAKSFLAGSSSKSASQAFVDPSLTSDWQQARVAESRRQLFMEQVMHRRRQVGHVLLLGAAHELRIRMMPVTWAEDAFEIGFLRLGLQRVQKRLA